MNLRAGRSQIKGGWIVAILLLFNGCRVTIKVPGYYVPEVRPNRSFHFGAGKSDITPPPGFPLGSSSTVGDAKFPQLVDSTRGDAFHSEILVSRIIHK
jgi:hypothetical protein